jgi:predicted DNA-binding transcriptional regulator AlpA
MLTPNAIIEPLLTEKEVARLLNISVATIRRRRLARQPPDFVKLNASIRYRPDAVRQFIAERERKANSGPKRATDCAPVPAAEVSDNR